MLFESYSRIYGYKLVNVYKTCRLLDNLPISYYSWFSRELWGLLGMNSQPDMENVINHVKMTASNLFLGVYLQWLYAI